jgi:predicted PurR-regulated permease PerM
MRGEKLHPTVKLTCVLLCIVLTGSIMVYAKGILVPLFFAMLASFLLLPLVRWLERRRVPRAIAVLISVLALLAALSGVIYLLSLQLISFSAMFPVIEQQIQENIRELQNWVSQRLHINGTQQMGYIDRASGAILASVSDFAQVLLVLFSGAALSVVFVFIYTYFMLYYRDILRDFLVKVLSQSVHSKVIDITFESRTVIYNYIFGLLLEMLIVATVNCLALMLFGIQYYMLIGIVAAILNIIPFLGFLVAVLIAFVITLSTGGVGDALQAILIMWIIHLLDANVLMPKIVGARVKMNALITIVAVLCGNMIWGVAGMFLFIPLVAIMKVVFGRIEGMEAWAILIGEREKRPVLPKDNP